MYRKLRRWIDGDDGNITMITHARRGCGTVRRRAWPRRARHLSIAPSTWRRTRASSRFSRLGSCTPCPRARPTARCACRFRSTCSAAGTGPREWRTGHDSDCRLVAPRSTSSAAPRALVSASEARRRLGLKRGAVSHQPRRGDKYSSDLSDDCSLATCANCATRSLVVPQVFHTAIKPRTERPTVRPATGRADTKRT